MRDRGDAWDVRGATPIDSSERQGTATPGDAALVKSGSIRTAEQLELTVKQLARAKLWDQRLQVMRSNASESLSTA